MEMIFPAGAGTLTEGIYEIDCLLLPLCFFGLYMILEAADWGLSLAAPIMSRNREENKAIIGLLRPGLDGNELWFFLGLFMLSAAIPTASKRRSIRGISCCACSSYWGLCSGWLHRSFRMLFRLPLL